MRKLIVLMALCACKPTPTPVPPHPDASDAAVLGDAPVVFALDAGDPCVRACAAMQMVGCVVRPDCVQVISKVTDDRVIRNARTGNALTCEDVAAVTSVADMAAMGQPCGVP